MNGRVGRVGRVRPVGYLERSEGTDMRTLVGVPFDVVTRTVVDGARPLRGEAGDR